MPFVGKRKEEGILVSKSRINLLKNSGHNIVNKSYDFNDKKTKIIYNEKLGNRRKFKSSKDFDNNVKRVIN